MTMGHVFAYLGRVEDLRCDARLAPVYRHSTVKPSWLHEDERGFRGETPPAGWRDATVRTFFYGASAGGPDVWLVDVGLDDKRDIDWLIESVKQWLPAALGRLNAPTTAKRVTSRGLPLLALHLVGSGRNNAEKVSGELVRRLLDAVEGFTKDHAADVVFVVNDREQYAALQHARRKRATSSLPLDLEETASALAEHARRGNLCLLTGAGLSMGAGLLSWDQLLDAVVPAGAKKPPKLPNADLTEWAKTVEALYPSSTEFRHAVSERCEGSRVSLGHGLLASLPVNEVVTLNYDTLFERAAAVDAGRTLEVIPHGRKGASPRWLLKLHGCATRPADIVITKEDYERFNERRLAFKGVVESLLITREMLVVGFSMRDPNVKEVLEVVKRAVETDELAKDRKVGTVLSLESGEPDDVYTCFNVMKIGEGLEFGHRVRLLELVLDRVALLAADPYEHLLDPRFDDLVGPDGTAVRKAVEDFVQKLRAPGVKAEAAERILDQFRAMGFERAPKSAEAKAKGEAK